MGSVVPLLLRPSAFELPGPFGEHLEQDFNFWELLGNFWEPAFELPGALGEHLEQDFNLWELLGNFREPIFNFWDLWGNLGFRGSGF